MNATVEEVLALANVEQCLEDTGVESTYNHCHNACCWLALQIKKAGLPDYNIFWCVGTFLGKDHSWLLIETENPENIEEYTQTVIDMTIDQFVPYLPVPYAGPQTPDYNILDSVLLCETDRLIEFADTVG